MANIPDSSEAPQIAPETTIDTQLDPVAPFEGLPSAEPETPAPLPSIPESQESTQKVVKFQDKVNRFLKRMKLTPGKENSTYADAQRVVLDIERESEVEQKAVEQKQQLQQQQAAAETQQQQEEELKKYNQDKAYAASKGLIASGSWKPDPKMEELNQKQQTEMFMQQAPAEAGTAAGEAPKTIEDQLADSKQLEQVEHQQMVSDHKQQVKQVNAEEEAEQQAFTEIEDKKQREIEEITNEIESKDVKVPINNFSDYWNSRSTGQKILTALGMLFASAGGGRNTAVAQINKYIDSDIKKRMDDQKLSKDEYWKHKDHALKVLDAKTRRMGQNINNKKLNIQIQQFRQSLDQQRKAVVEKRIQAEQNKLKSKEGYTQEDLAELDQQTKNVLVRVGDRYYKVLTAETKKRLDAEMPAAKKSLSALKRLQEISNMSGKSLNLALRAEGESLQTQLIGATRLELFGPGVLTESEQKLARKIIPNPTKITSLDVVNRAKLQIIYKKINQSMRYKLRQSGINLPESRNEKLLKEYAKKKGTDLNKGDNRATAINALINLKKWDENEELGF